jgi:DNA-binding NarL/FixJ family response regulator
VIRFCVVDDHQVIREGLSAMAQREDGLEFAGSSENLREASGLLANAKPDVLFLDLRLNGKSSIDTCDSLSKDHPQVKIVIFSAYGNPELLRQSIRAGAAGYILKDTSTQLIPNMLRELTTSGTYYDSRLSGSLLRQSGNPKNGEAFSERELSIIAEVSRGSDTYAIAELLHVSPHTVKYHISAMLKRHKLQRRSELVHLAMKLHLLD